MLVQKYDYNYNSEYFFMKENIELPLLQSNVSNNESKWFTCNANNKCSYARFSALLAELYNVEYGKI